MSQPSVSNRDTQLWLIGGIGLLWNAAGVMNVMMQLNASMLAAMPAEQRAFVEARPSWATIAFAIGVIAGFLGCLLLLLRRREAFSVLAVSLVAIAVHMLSYFAGQSLTAAFSPAGVLFFVLLPLVVATFLVWFANKRRLA